MVAVSIGGNDFGFGSLVQTCVQDFLLSASFWQKHCHDDQGMAGRFTAEAVAARSARIAQSLGNVHEAMTRAGYQDTSYRIVVQDYPAPLPDSGQMRYADGWHVRQLVGGCGLWNSDLSWAAQTVVPSINAAVRTAVTRAGVANVEFMDVGRLFDGHRLCERGVGKLYEQHLASWRDPGAADRSEWVENIRTISAVASPYFIAESLHPNYWGQLALRQCLQRAYDGSGHSEQKCAAAGGTDSNGAPKVTLTPGAP